MNTGLLRYAVGTVLTVYGIETLKTAKIRLLYLTVGTVLTVYGIETSDTAVDTASRICWNSAYRLRY